MLTREQLIERLPERLRDYNFTGPFENLDDANLVMFYHMAVFQELAQSTVASTGEAVLLPDNG